MHFTTEQHSAILSVSVVFSLEKLLFYITKQYFYCIYCIVFSDIFEKEMSVFLLFVTQQKETNTGLKELFNLEALCRNSFSMKESTWSSWHKNRIQNIQSKLSTGSTLSNRIHSFVCKGLKKITSSCKIENILRYFINIQ